MVFSVLVKSSQRGSSWCVEELHVTAHGWCGNDQYSTNFGFCWSLLWMEGMVAMMIKYMAKQNWRTLTLQTLIAWFWSLQSWLRNLELVNLDMVIRLCYSWWKWVRCWYFSWHVWLSAEVAKRQISETLAKYTCHFKRSPVNFLAYSVSMGECC